MRYLLLSIVFLFSLSMFAQQTERKSIDAYRIDSPIEIDGYFHEAEWQNAPLATDFVQNSPNPGKPASKPTEVRVLYDDEAIYIAATLYDVSRDSILTQLSKRDMIENADVFGIYIDTYNDRLNAFQFLVTASGVQVDARLSPAGDDIAWDGVWYSKVRIDDTNWYVEMKIPYSALRFTEREEQVWGVNFLRRIRRKRENSYWNDIKPEVDGFVNQFGELRGIKGITPPTRLFFFPYASGYGDYFQRGQAGQSNWGSTFNAGMDVKYGINDAFTLDMTLIPDFGQVLPDNEVLNLTPFEVFFIERRQFFTEGTELFNKGGIFYSRRIGGRPLNYMRPYQELGEGERVVENPQESRLLNSTKVSGRTDGGLGVGILNSVTGETNAIIENEDGEQREVMTDPLSNYNVFVLDQNLKNNSFVSLINTNVTRAGDDYNANVTGTQFQLNDKDNTYTVRGRGAISQKYGLPDGNEFGHSFLLRGAKISGNWQYGIEQQMETDTYDPNDLGFLQNNNELATRSNIGYNIFKPKGNLLRMWSNFTLNYFRLYNPDVFTGFTHSGSVGVTVKGFHSANMNYSIAPIGWRDYFEPRAFGRYYQFPSNYNIGGWISTDYSRPLAIDVNFSYMDADENNRHTYSLGFSPRIRVSDKLFIITNSDFTMEVDDVGWVNTIDDVIFFGVRDRRTLINMITARYTFTNTMDLFLRVRHYWSAAQYSEYNILGESGELLPAEIYTTNHDINFNLLNLDLIYTWVFTPGSELSIVWKQDISGVDSEVEQTYFYNARNVYQLNQLNSFSIRVIYFLDYLWLKRNG